MPRARSGHLNSFSGCVLQERVAAGPRYPDRPVLEVYTRRRPWPGTHGSEPGQAACTGRVVFWNRYCINDLHRAAGGEARHRPTQWLRTKIATDLVEELENSDALISASEQNQRVKPVNVVKGLGQGLDLGI